MNDNDLIEELRDEMRCNQGAANRAADAVERLTAERDQWKDRAERTAETRNKLDNEVHAWMKREQAAREQVVQLTEALRALVGESWYHGAIDPMQENVDRARAVLADHAVISQEPTE